MKPKNKKKHIINLGCHKPYFTLEEALSRIYEVKGYKQKKKKGIEARINVPSILIGHKIKLLLIKS